MENNDSKKKGCHRFNLFDGLLAGFILLALFAAYATLIKPVHFSGLIEREGISQYAEVNLVLADDLAWLGEKLKVGEGTKNVYGQVDWKLTGVESTVLAGRGVWRVRARLLATRETSGLVRYGKYTLVIGGKLFLIDDNVFVEGRILSYKLLQEKVAI